MEWSEVIELQPIGPLILIACAICGHDIDDHAEEGFSPCIVVNCDCKAFTEEESRFH